MHSCLSLLTQRPQIHFLNAAFRLFCEAMVDVFDFLPKRVKLFLLHFFLNVTTRVTYDTT